MVVQEDTRWIMMFFAIFCIVILALREAYRDKLWASGFGKMSAIAVLPFAICYLAVVIVAFVSHGWLFGLVNFIVSFLIGVGVVWLFRIIRYAKFRERDS